MLVQKEGFPEEGELVLCKITKIHHHGVFADLSEYKRSGMIHISEIAPGRIRNIRDYVKEGKVVVCNVLRISQERGYIDLSLRRVNDNQRRKKVNSIKQEQKAERIVEFLAKEIKKDPKKLYEEIQVVIANKYRTFHDCFEDIVTNNVTIEDLGIDSTYAKQLEVIVRQRIKPPVVMIKGKINATSYEPNGVEIIKKALIKSQEAGKENTTIKYLGAGKFSVEIEAEEYKEAEEIVKNVIDAATQSSKNTNTTVTFVRETKK